jgi:GT2 family glycosyltransferase
MRVSVLHWNSPAACLATVGALRASGLPLEIVVVDNGSSPENRAALARGLPADVELLPLPANLGWGTAHNVVLRRWLDHEASEFCMVSAHDALPVGSCVAQVVRELEQHSGWGMACPEYGVPEVPSYSVLWGARLRPVAPRPPGATEEVDYCHGTLAVFRRACLREIGLHDEGFFAYGDETEIGLRARSRGWKVGLVWGAVLVNPGSGSGGAAIGYLWTRSTLRLARRYGGIPGLLGRLAVVLGATVRERFRGAPADSLSSPGARWLGIADYFRGRTGAPPQEISAPRRNAPAP